MPSIEPGSEAASNSRRCRCRTGLPVAPWDRSEPGANGNPWGSNVSSWLYVMGPAIPSAGGPAVAVWKALSEASVFGPKNAVYGTGTEETNPREVNEVLLQGRLQQPDGVALVTLSEYGLVVRTRSHGLVLSDGRGKDERAGCRQSRRCSSHSGPVRVLARQSAASSARPPVIGHANPIDDHPGCPCLALSHSQRGHPWHLIPSHRFFLMGTGRRMIARTAQAAG